MVVSPVLAEGASFALRFTAQHTRLNRSKTLGKEPNVMCVRICAKRTHSSVRNTERKYTFRIVRHPYSPHGTRILDLLTRAAHLCPRGCACEQKTLEAVSISPVFFLVKLLQSVDFVFTHFRHCGVATGVPMCA